MKNLNSFKKLLEKYNTIYVMDIDYIDCLGNVQQNFTTISALEVLKKVGAKNFLEALRSFRGIQIDYCSWSGASQIAHFNF